MNERSDVSRTSAKGLLKGIAKCWCRSQLSGQLTLRRDARVNKQPRAVPTSLDSLVFWGLNFKHPFPSSHCFFNIQIKISQIVYRRICSILLNAGFLPFAGDCQSRSFQFLMCNHANAATLLTRDSTPVPPYHLSSSTLTTHPCLKYDLRLSRR